MSIVEGKTGILLLGIVTIGMLAILVVGGSPEPPTTVADFTVCPSGCPYSSIQEAIDAAPAWTHILVKEGTYTPADGESITISKDLILEGEDPEKVIIRGGAHLRWGSPGYRYSLPIMVIEDAHVVITGFTISGNWTPQTLSVGDEVGIAIRGRSDASIFNNHLHNINGTGIVAVDTTQVAIFDNTIRNTYGISIAGRAQASIYDDNVITGGRYNPGIFVRQESQARIWGNFVHDNGAIGIQVGQEFYAGTGWVTFRAMAQASIYDNEISSNMLEGIVIAGNGMADILNNRIHHNGWAGVAVAVTNPAADCNSIQPPYGFDPEYPFKGVLTGWANEVHDNSQGYECRYPGAEGSALCPPPPAHGLDLCPPDYPWPPGFVKGP
ncbi:MAG: right-handed parallel beta-helix repeat-containing protein [Candidatus Acetothermia bacterium]|nr:right-handed parallel beta-helix repeat-containing protein [Candidatus Acetothermia bacterium]MDH7556605.1 right-handed parallel beta-helix repeat-containing protein [Candidatus Methanosuratincola sp.]